MLRVETENKHEEQAKKLEEEDELRIRGIEPRLHIVNDTKTPQKNRPGMNNGLVFRDTNTVTTVDQPMHLHGHSFYIVRNDTG
ncbi:hypothetical protein V6N13_128439 [Hibiscus sabdariffa]